MAELATAGNDAFRVSALTPTGPARITVDMVQILQGQLPPGCELFFLMGFDSLTELPTWHDPAH